MKAVTDDGKEKSVNVLARLNTSIELNYYRNGGILQTVLRQMVGAERHL